MNIHEMPVATAEMLIRKPIATVFDAFVDPAITSKSWFTKGSGRLEAGKRVRWDWDMYGVSVEVVVKALEVNKRILIEWPGDHAPTTVEWRFTPRPDHTTFVSIKNQGFSGEGDAVMHEAIASTEGFVRLFYSQDEERRPHVALAKCAASSARVVTRACFASRFKSWIFVPNSPLCSRSSLLTSSRPMSFTDKGWSTRNPEAALARSITS